MTQSDSSEITSQQIHGTDQENLGAAQAKEAGAKFEWHFGRLTRLGYYEGIGGKGVTILWEEGGMTSQQGAINDDQWEIFSLAFKTTGRIAILSDASDDTWMYDYRILEVAR